MKARIGALALAISTTVGVVPIGLEAGAAAPCSVVWGSLVKEASATVTAPLVNIRAGRHDCYDRIVFDISGPANGYHVEYKSPVTGLASGDVIPLRGGASLEVVLSAPDVDENGNLTYPRAGRRELVNVSGFRTFRQAAWAESQEGLTAIGLGVRARLPFRVFVLPGPGAGSRIVIDVAHTW